MGFMNLKCIPSLAFAPLVLLLHLWQTDAIEEAGEATSQHTTPQQYSYYIGWYVFSSVSHHWQSNATQLISGAAARGG